MVGGVQCSLCVQWIKLHVRYKFFSMTELVRRNAFFTFCSEFWSKKCCVLKLEKIIPHTIFFCLDYLLPYFCYFSPYIRCLLKRQFCPNLSTIWSNFSDVKYDVKVLKTNVSLTIWSEFDRPCRVCNNIIGSSSQLKVHFVFFFLTGYSAAALLAIVFALPFAIGMIAHKDSGVWRHFGQAFYSAHLELFLGNACIGKIEWDFWPLIRQKSVLGNILIGPLSFLQELVLWCY